MVEGTRSLRPEAVAPSVPAPVDLRPLTTSELIDRGFSLYRANFAGLLLLALLTQTAPMLAQIATQGLHLTPGAAEFAVQPGHFALKIAGMIGLSQGAHLLTYCFEIVLTVYIADAYLGNIPSVTDSLLRLKGLVVRSIWTCVLSSVLIFLTFIFPLLAMVAIMAFYFFYPPQQFYSTLLAFVGASLLALASIAPFLVVFMRLMLTTPVLALEETWGWAAVRRSTTLVRYDPGLGLLYWGEMRLSFLLLPLFAIELLTLSLTSLPMVILQINQALRHGESSPFATPSDFTVILSQVLIFLAGAFIVPLYAIAITLFYYDVRIRREGFDLEFMASRMGDAP